MTTAALEKAVDHLCDFMDALGAHFPAPSMEIIGHGTVFRHRDIERTANLACHLKAVKICTTLRAAVVLVREGLVAEAYALCRTSDELGEDILFLMKPRGEGGGYSANQQRFLTEFYQEEFDKPDDPLAGSAEAPLVMSVVEGTIAGKPLDQAGEMAARAARWVDSSPP